MLCSFSKGCAMEKINVRGISFDNVTKGEALALISSRLDEGKRTVVFTPNSEIVESCIEDASFRELISSADILLPDGIGVVKASKLLGTPLKEKVPGVEVGEELVKTLKNRSFFLLGGKKESSKGCSVAESAKSSLEEKYACNIVGTMHGYFDKNGDENEAVIETINRSGADILYVCLGSPAQEKWIFENKDKLSSAKLILALGGSLDVYAGETKRAPELFIKCGLEWLWRLLCEPSRIGRMMKLPKFYFGTILYKMKQKKK